MKTNKFKNPIFLFYALVFYVFAQFLWWWYLIFKLNQSLVTQQEFYNKKIWMILGEGLVFFVLLIIGILAVKKAFKRQIQLNKKEESFLLSVSHELKTPIASIQLFLQTLQKHKQLNNVEKNNIYNNALHEVNRLDSIVSNILIARQIENDNNPLQKEKTDIKALIITNINIIESTLGKHHTFKTNLNNVIANIDIEFFESIIINLIENAIKYSNKNSQININLIDKENHFLFIIQDQGKGISKENLPYVFNKFYREENELTRQTKGTGLGLYIVKYLVNKHNGNITLKNNLPKGLTVTIKIPK